MKIVISPKYMHLSDVISRLPEYEYSGQELIRDQRNTLFKINVDGAILVVKRYKKPNLLNRFVYTFVRKSKARRSYEYANRLIGLGIETAEPVAYIEIKKYGFFHTGYFVSEFLDLPLLGTIEDGKLEREEMIRVLKDFAGFTVDLHKKKVIHYDYSLTNVFYYRDNDQKSYKFILIDINRMKFKYLRPRECMKSLSPLLGFKMPIFVVIAEHYATLRGWNTQLFCGGLLMKQGVNLKQKFKRPFKALGRWYRKLFEKKTG